MSIDVVFEIDQLRERTHRIDLLLTCVLAPDPAPEIVRLIAELAQTAEDRRSIRRLFAAHYSLLARKVAERSAATGEHYITRDAAEYRAMLRAAAGGGAIVGATTLIKIALLAVAPRRVLGRRRRGPQLRDLVRRHPDPALHARHQAAGDDGTGDGRKARRRVERRRARGLRRRGGAPHPLAGRRHHRQRGRRHSGRARSAVDRPRRIRRADRRRARRRVRAAIAHPARADAASSPPSPACCCSPAR